MSQKNILALVAEGFEEIELVSPVDLLRRAGAKVVLASVDGQHLVAGRCGVVVRAEEPLSAIPVDSGAFDMLFVPGGPAVATLRQNARVGEWARAFADAGRWIAAICAAPLVLHDAGLLAERRFTAYPATRDEMPHALLEERVVRDGNIITSRGAGTALDFGFELVRVLYGEAATEKLAQEIVL